MVCYLNSSCEMLIYAIMLVVICNMIYSNRKKGNYFVICEITLHIYFPILLTNNCLVNSHTYKFTILVFLFPIIIKLRRQSPYSLALGVLGGIDWLWTWLSVFLLENWNYFTLDHPRSYLGPEQDMKTWFIWCWVTLDNEGHLRLLAV